MRAEVGFGPERLGWLPDRVRAAVDQVLDELGLAPLAGRHPYDLPGPTRRLVAFAAALVANPQLLILDEPTAGMSVDDVPVVLDLIRALKAQRNKTILLVEHKMDVVRELADRIIVLHNGQLVADGEPEAVIASPVVQNAYLGVSTEEPA
ncbi:ATP-binding cassette domain-containing protein [Piscinibacter sp.]|uniref:ATP-binding cassette domain-containing protein n=1 Tax=Piscinibacter sp. TaxID=1903157 RepID=UPI003784A6F5